MVKFVIGCIGLLLAIFVGAYVGLWVCFIGGIMGIITAITTVVAGGTVAMSLIAFSILKIMMASLVGWVCAMVIGLPSVALIMNS